MAKYTAAQGTLARKTGRGGKRHVRKAPRRANKLRAASNAARQRRRKIGR